MQTIKILINLDCFFDVKLATVIEVNEDWVLPLFDNGYITRQHNTLSLLNPEINDSVLEERWKTRDISLLKLTKRTALIKILSDYISQSKEGDPEHPQSVEFKLVINTYPYEFTKKEIKELFICLREILYTEAITRVHIPIGNLTPSYIKSSYDRFVIYNLDEWLLIHGNNLLENPMPLVTCMTPFCYRKGMENTGEGEEARRQIPASLAPFLDLELINLGDVSVFISPDYFKENKK